MHGKYDKRDADVSVSRKMFAPRLNIKQKLLTGQCVDGTSMWPKPSAIRNIFTNILNNKGNSLSWDSKLINPNPFRQKKGKIVSLCGTKGSLTQKKYNSISRFFLKILTAVCLGFVHVPDIGPVPFEIFKLAGNQWKKPAG